jgi:hypothetical protein
MKFSYGSGQRPLDGYTLKRGIGRGGFGEVYYAVSDGGKEVALKLVRGDKQIELRGVAQCLNLKHPNLVALYDLRRDIQGDHWVVMEYVAGETLSIVLNRHPNGFPRELVREWFIGLARAVGYLHDHGIVHRDLKPGNVFIENGLVKVGDYGLSKAIGASQRTAQTQSVGTVHYMAPEISTGNYNKQIDVYAAGVILYEMLSGRPPFDGESAGEILMKHLTAPPDLSKLPTEFAPIVAKALAKNPAQRYGSVAEMARAVEALPLDAQRVPTPAAAPKVPPMRAIPVVEPPRNAPPAKAPDPVLTALPAVTFRGQLLELCGSLALAVVFAALATTLWIAVSRQGRVRNLGELSDLGTVFFLTVATSWTILIPAKFWTDRRGDSWTRRVIMMILGAGVGFGALWLNGWSVGLATSDWTADTSTRSALGTVLPDNILPEASYLSYYALAFFALRWWRMADRRRPQRFSFAPLLAAGFWGWVLVLLVHPDLWSGAVVLVLASAIVQLVSPWEQPPPPTPKRLRLRYA